MDKIITEFFIEKFIIETSRVLFLVLGAFSLDEKKLLERVKKI